MYSKDNLSNIPESKEALLLAIAIHNKVASELLELLNGVPESEVSVSLANNILQLADKHLAQQKLLMRFANVSPRGKGRPGMARLATLLGPKTEARKPIGRPLKYGAQYDLEKYRQVAAIRDAHALETGTKPAIRKIIDDLNAQAARDAGQDEGKAIELGQSRDYNAYQRAKRRLKIQNN